LDGLDLLIFAIRQLARFDFEPTPLPVLHERTLLHEVSLADECCNDRLSISIELLGRISDGDLPKLQAGGRLWAGPLKSRGDGGDPLISFRGRGEN